MISSPLGPSTPRRACLGRTDVEPQTVSCFNEYSSENDNRTAISWDTHCSPTMGSSKTRIALGWRGGANSLGTSGDKVGTTWGDRVEAARSPEPWKKFTAALADGPRVRYHTVLNPALLERPCIDRSSSSHSARTGTPDRVARRSGRRCAPATVRLPATRPRLRAQIAPGTYTIKVVSVVDRNISRRDGQRRQGDARRGTSDR